MNLEKCIKVKKHTSNYNLVKIEKWLRDEAASGKKLVHVKMGLFTNTYYFIEAANCNEIYFDHANFGKNTKLRRTSVAVLSYLQSKHGAKKLSKVDGCLWIRLSQSKISDLNDIKANLLIREKCIATELLQRLAVSFIPTVAFAILSIFDTSVLLFASISFAGFAIFLIQLLLHRKYCKEIYTDFLK